MANTRAVLFDLDGTFADTAPDLADALNATLTARGKPALPFDAIRPVVSHGGKAMIKLAFNLDPEDGLYEEIRQQFLDIYLENIAVKTSLFPGIETLIDQLEDSGIAWGIVTNKPSWLTDPLMQALKLFDRAGCIVSGDTASKAKPHPEPMYYACEKINVRPEQCIYVGDAERDIEAGRVAGMKTIAALFGYLLEDDNPDQWGADAMIDHASEIWAFVEKW
ncbi:MAG: phosphoglycolate phosphatase [Gammaproteobacteria bacterium]|nr:phosphoglycolate phosphatase [Gammaproteobacteria bacterium]